MCKSGACEGWCDYEEAVWCPVLETVAKFWIPEVTENMKITIPNIIRGNAQWTAEFFFKHDGLNKKEHNFKKVLVWNEYFFIWKMEPLMGFEPMTSPLPWERSTSWAIVAKKSLALE